jgi:hypothetical protein
LWRARGRRQFAAKRRKISTICPFAAGSAHEIHLQNKNRASHSGRSHHCCRCRLLLRISRNGRLLRPEPAG